MVENSTLWQRTPFSAPVAETQLSACMVQSQILNCIVGLQLLNTMVGPQLLNTMVGPQLNLFQNLPNSQPISYGHDVIHTPVPFPVWGLLWQSPLSYPLRASVNCTNWLHTWTLNPNSSKPNQYNWWKMIKIKKSFLNYITVMQCSNFIFNCFGLFIKLWYGTRPNK